MKKNSIFTVLLIFTNVITICILVWCCCFRTMMPCDTCRARPVSPVPLKGGAAPIPPCASCCPDNCYEEICDAQPRFDMELARKMVANYRAHHWATINRYCPSIMSPNFYTSPDPEEPSLFEEGKFDARSAWFSLESVKKFINAVETQTCLNRPRGCSDIPKLGVRIYYAEYPVVGSELKAYADGANRMDTSYAGMHTLLMVPTFDEESGRHVDFDPENNFDGKCPAYSVFDTSYTGTDLLALAAQNHGSLAPPPYLCDDYWFTTGSLFMRYVDRKDYNSTTSPTSYNTYCPPTQ
jgi:hypothetical protein